MTLDLSYAAPDFWHTNHDTSPLGLRLTAAVTLSALVYGEPTNAAYAMECSGWTRAYPMGATESEGVVGVDETGGNIVIALRGTDFDGWRWWQDVLSDAAHAVRVHRSSWMPKGARYALGSVRFVERALPGLQDIRERLVDPADRPWRVFFVGHSLAGGAVHTAVPLAVSLGVVPRAVYGIAPPRVTNEAGMQAHRELCRREGIQCYRVMSVVDGARDWVPQSPPKWMGARHCGQRVVVDRRSMGSRVFNRQIAMPVWDRKSVEVKVGSKARDTWLHYKNGTTPSGGWRRYAPHVAKLVASQAAHGAEGLAEDLAWRDGRDGRDER